MACLFRFASPVPSADRPYTTNARAAAPRAGQRSAPTLNRPANAKNGLKKSWAVIGTGLVLAVFVLSGGTGLLEGVAVYAIAGAALFYAAKKTFTPNRPAQGLAYDRQRTAPHEYPQAA